MTADRSSRAESAAVDALVAEATQCFAAGRLDDAAARCRVVLDAVPDHPAARRQLGLIRIVEHAFDEAHALLAPLAHHFADDADVRLALAEAIWGTRGAADALPEFEAACALAPDRPRLRLRLGQALLAANRVEAARAALETAVAALPGSAAALTQLAIAEAASGEVARAIARLEAASALDPADPDPPFQLGLAWRAAGRIDAAIAALREAVRRAPDGALQRVALGDALAACDQHAAAEPALREAVRLAPRWGLAWMVLGRIVQRLRRVDEAVGYYRTAHALDRGLPELDALIGNALLEAGAAAEAQLHFALSLGRTRWAAPTSTAAVAAPAATTQTDRRPRVGVLLAPGANNTPTGFILDAAAHDLENVFMVAGFDYPHARMAASYDVLFNAIGDSDRAATALAVAVDVTRAVALPVINPPALIAATGRDRMAARLADLADCHVPPTRRCAVAALRAPDALDALARDVGLPVLARPVGSHGGDDLVKLDDPAALAAHVAASTAEALYLTRFHDFRSADGRYRKYRFIVVAGEIYPYHLAIGEHWLVHYFRTGMAGSPALLEEEARFLTDWRRALGGRIEAALGAIVGRVGLDFFGLDCSVDRTGALLVFECNATMLVHEAGASPAFDFKRGPTERIRQAVGRMLAGRAKA